MCLTRLLSYLLATPCHTQVAVGKREFLTVFGSDYATPDGTGVRDYIHVQDLAEGHLLAMNFMTKSPPGWYTHNLGTGRGYRCATSA